MQAQVHEVLNDFNSISLKEIECVRLMTRTDAKFQCRLDQLALILRKAQSGFRVLEIRGSRIAGYETLYLDTADHRMYLDHHNGKLNRYKIRIRQYLSSGEFFLEIKKKDNHRNTEKKRIPITGQPDYQKAEYAGFIIGNSPYHPMDLHPVLYSGFSRITLVNTEIFERVTIDIHPVWKSGNRTAGLPNVVIIEVKSAKTSNHEGFGHLLREERIQPGRISKYCTGTALLYPDIKHNRFKEKLLHLHKLDKKIIYDEPAIEFI